FKVPPTAFSRSWIPMRPRPRTPRRACTARTSNPVPLSWMEQRSRRPSRTNRIVTWLAWACFVTLVSASWTMRYRAVSVGAGMRDPLDLLLQRLVQPPQRLLRTLAIGDIAGDPQDADDASVLGLGHRRELPGNVGARLGADAQLERRRDPARQDDLQERHGAREIVRMDEGRELFADPLGAEPAGDGLEHRIQGLDLPVDRQRVPGRHRPRRHLHAVGFRDLIFPSIDSV